MYQPGEKSPCSEDHCGGPETQAKLRDHTYNPILFQQEIIHSLLKQHEIWLILQPSANSLFIQNTVCLCSGGTHSRTLARVENSKLDAGFVRRRRHCTPEGVYFFDQMPLTDAANRGIARHLAESFDAVG